ncbi:hypothetical protein HZS_688, partial [Henneguya salminicola]
MADFKFSNLYGSVYSKGNVTFSRDGYSIISPVGNRVTVYDLKRNNNYTFETQNRRNIKCLGLAPDDNLLLTVDEEGQCVCSSLKRRIPIHFFNFKAPVQQVKFSPDNTYIAVACQNMLHVFFTPVSQPQFRPFVLHRKYKNFNDKISCIDWSDNSLYICAGNRDMTVRLICVNNQLHFKSNLLCGFKKGIIGSFFLKESLDIFAIDTNGTLIKWTCAVETMFWQKESKHDLRVDNCSVSCCAFEKNTKILVFGYTNGLFSLYEYTTMSLVQKISVTQHKIDSIAINSTGDWLAFASSTLGQLIVWEYKNESYVLKQQGHTMNMKCVDYSPDGCFIASGSEDGKIKIWNASTGFCVVTFEEHSSSITSVLFSNSCQFVLSSCLDGTCRTFDLNRYRNFRTFVATSPVQFSTIAIDYSDEIVCASAVDNFNIFIWSVLTGRLLETVSGHTSPVASLAFLPRSSHLVSCSWDQTVRVWDILNSGSSVNLVSFSADCLCVAPHPFKRIIAICTIRAHIILWDHESEKILGTIEGLKDLGLARNSDQLLTAESSMKFRYFTSIVFSPDGEFIIACGKSKYICIYDTNSLILLNKIQVSNNQSLDGILVRLNSSKMTEAGPLQLLENTDSEEELRNEKTRIKIPGSLKKDLSARKINTQLLLYGVKVCPTGRSFVCVSTEGLLIFSKDTKYLFDPIDITYDITRDTVIQLLEKNDPHTALIFSINIAEFDLISQCLESISLKDIRFVASGLSLSASIKILEVVSDMIDNHTPHLEFYLMWCNSILMANGLNLKNEGAIRYGNMLSLLRKIQKALNYHINNVGRLCESN